METDKLVECFDVIDSDRGGTISIDEFKRFNAAQARPCSYDTLQKVFLDVDADGSGEVDKEEFVDMVKRLEKEMGVSMTAMADAFEVSCYNDLFKLVGDGAAALSAQELRQMVDSVNATLQLGHSNEDIRRIFKEYDTDGSGAIEVDEFEGVMRAIKKRANISHLLWAFDDWKQQSRARMARFKNAFGTKDVADAQTSPRSPAKKSFATTTASPVCPVCPIQEAKIASLEAALADATAGSAAKEKAYREKAAVLEARLREAEGDAAAGRAEMSPKSGRSPPRRRKAAGKDSKDEAMHTLAERLEEAEEKLQVVKAALAIRTQANRMLHNQLCKDPARAAEDRDFATGLARECMKAAYKEFQCDIEVALAARHIYLDLPAFHVNPSSSVSTPVAKDEAWTFVNLPAEKKASPPVLPPRSVSPNRAPGSLQHSDADKPIRNVSFGHVRELSSLSCRHDDLLTSMASMTSAVPEPCTAAAPGRSPRERRAESVKSTKSSYAYALSELGDLLAGEADRSIYPASEAGPMNNFSINSLPACISRNVSLAPPSPPPGYARPKQYAAPSVVSSVGQQSEGNRSRYSVGMQTAVAPQQPQPQPQPCLDIQGLQAAISGAQAVLNGGQGSPKAGTPQRQISLTGSLGGAPPSNITSSELNNLRQQLMEAQRYAAAGGSTAEQDAVFSLIQRTLRNVLGASGSPPPTYNPASPPPSRVPAHAPPDVRAVLLAAQHSAHLHRSPH
eukprot:TRINITY_DN4088_c0_g1_i1.p1 TRINITY_DN4088_c0_g1~~TRINITY_DN4088_c0_g1_i1.p1  ORF type:complete len:734 (+),score=223.57 TRINITY_DN4088_c0_g1_i1:73-2274(+)